MRKIHDQFKGSASSGDTSESRAGRRIISLQDLGPGDHVCCIYRTEAEHRAVLAPFIRYGLERNEKVFYIVDAHTAGQVMDYMRKEGVDIDKYVKKGQFSVLQVSDSYMKSGVFDPEKMIALLKSETAKAVKEGYSALRVTGEMSWALKELPGSERLFEYEAMLNEFFPGSRALAICQYDARKFSPQMLMSVLDTHPVAVIGTTFYDNFYFMPAKDMLAKDRFEARLRNRIKNLGERKTAEEELRDSEAKYKSLFETASVMMQSVGPDGRYLLVNREWRERLGYGGSDLKRLTFMDVVRKDFREHCANAFRQVSAGKSLYGIDVVFVAKDGSEMEVSGNIRPVMKDGKFIYTVGSFVDVTERKKAENITRDFAKKLEREVETRTEELHASNEELKATNEEMEATNEELKATGEDLRASEEKYRTIVENINDAILTYDSTGRILDVNENACKVFGYSKKEIIGSTLEKINSKESRPKVRKRLSELFKKGKLLWETTDRRKDGSPLPVYVSASVISRSGRGIAQSFVRDITDIRKAESEIRESEALLRATMESTADGILVIDSGGKVTFSNKKFQEHWRIPQKLVEMRDDKKLLSYVLSQLSDPNEFMSKVKSLYAHPKEESFDTLHFKDGRVFDRYSKPQYLGDRVVGRVWSFRDVSAQRKAEDSLVESSEELKATNEEMEATNEELKATNEEVVKRNRELEEFREFAVTREAELARLKENADKRRKK